MSGFVATTSDRAPRVARASLLAAARDAAVVAGWFAVAGLLGAAVWWQLAPLPKVAKSGESATVAPQELVRQVGIDGWFFVIAGVAGLVSGLVLLGWRHRDPLLMVVLVVLGGALASWLMVNVGLALGPEREVVALRGQPDGAEVSMQLKLNAPGIAWVWPIAALLGALSDLWFLEKTGAEES